MQKKILVLSVNLAILLCIGLVCIAPVLATAAAGTVASSAGCDLDEGSIHPCLINGTDYGETLYTLGMMAWFTFFSVPLAVGLLAVYLIVIAVISIVRFLRKRKNASSEMPQA